ncbi:MAG TPA: HAD family hydrolase [Acidimicrobiia bacterium]
MTRVEAGSAIFEVDAIAFDKDGTLVDLDAVWGPAGRAWVATAAAGDDELEAILADRLGLDLVTGRLVPGGMIAVGSVNQIHEATLAILTEQGVEKEESQSLAKAARSTAVMAADAQGQVPLGDVAGTLMRLQEAGLRLAVVSSDNRAAVDAAILALGIRSLIDAVVAGDDGFDAKPAPDALLEAARRLGVEPNQMLYVGDSWVDAGAGRAAGIAGTVLVGEPTAEARGLASVVVPGVDSLRVV